MANLLRGAMNLLGGKGNGIRGVSVFHTLHRISENWESTENKENMIRGRDLSDEGIDTRRCTSDLDLLINSH